MENIVIDYFIECNGEKYIVKLTDEQERMIQWLEERNMLENDFNWCPLCDLEANAP